MKPIILASRSPRRREILENFRLEFETVVSDFDEDGAEVLSDPVEYADSLAKAKVGVVAKDYGDRVVLGADTIVVQDEKYFGKPKDRKEAKNFLTQFSGNWQTVITALAVYSNGQVFADHEVTRLKMNMLSEAEIERYLDLGLWHDKAGGYTVVGPSALLVERMEGCFYNVLGLPLNPLSRLLKRANINLWEHL
ncbi:MAG: septum formation protein Maf [Chlamydiia bacterium]|nr:septum formation protein Maf [Chlamydiia bacterium]